MHSFLGSFLNLVRRAGIRKPAETELELKTADSDIQIVCLVAGDQDRGLLDQTAARHRWKLLFAQTEPKAREMASRLKPAIILLDRDVPGADWRNAVSSLAASSGGGCVVLISRVTDDYLWNEVVSSGGYDVLPKPLREEDVLRTVKLAWFYWNGLRSISAPALARAAARK